jgi:hypothetical protein
VRAFQILEEQGVPWGTLITGLIRYGRMEKANNTKMVRTT